MDKDNMQTFSHNIEKPTRVTKTPRTTTENKIVMRACVVNFRNKMKF